MSKIRLKKVLKDSIVMLLSEGLLKASQLVVNLFIARKLSVSGYGLFSNVFAVTQIFSILSDYGMSVLLINECKKRSETDSIDIIAEYFPLKMLLSCLFIILSFVLSLFDSSSSSLLYVLLAIYNVIQFGFLNMLYVYFRVRRDFIREAFTKLFNIIGLLIGFIIFYYSSSVKYAAFPYFLSAFVPFLWLLINLKLVKRLSFQNVLRRIKTTLKKVLLPGSSQVLSTTFTIIPFIFLRLSSSEYWVGIFAASYKIILPLIMLSGILTTVLLPRIEGFTKSLSKYKRYSIWLLILSVAISFFVVSRVSSETVVFLYGTDYTVAGESLWVLAPLPFVSFLSQMYGNYLLYKEGYKLHMVTSILGLSMLFLLAFLLKSFIPNPSVSMSLSLLGGEMMLALSRILLTKK